MTTFDFTSAAARKALVLGRQPVGDGGEEALERYATIVWSHLTEPGDGVAGRMVSRLGAAGALGMTLGHGMPDAGVLSENELMSGRKRWLTRLSEEEVSTSLRIAAATGIRIVTRTDPDWPRQLDDLGEHAPLCLWVRGDPGALVQLIPSVAIVGARAATSYGEHVATELAADLAGGGVPVVSGGAYGIDGAAHRAAMAVRGLTVAMLAGGADRAYPAGHSELIARIAESGAVVSEVPCGSAPTKWRFLQRNRLIAAMTSATVVVEAGWRSGSLNTAAHAAALSRGLGAVPGPITSAASVGTHRLLREFDARCVTSGADVRELLGGASPGAPADPAESGGERPRTDDATRVRDALSTRSWRTSGDIARRCGMSTDEVEPILGLLHLEREIVRGNGGWRAVAGAHST